MTCLMLVWLPTSPLQGAVYYWDSDEDNVGNDSAGTGIGGSGLWNLTSPNWWDALGTMDNVAWPNQLSDTAIFNGEGGLVTLAGSVNAGTLMFGGLGYSLTGGTLTLGDVARIHVAPGLNATIGSILAGSSGLTKTGNGTLILTNNANSYTGDTVINGGALVITNEGQLGSSTNTISVMGIANTGNPGYSGGQLVVVGGVAGIVMNRDISLLGRGPGALNGSGALVSVGNNTFNGSLQVAGPASEARVTATHGTTTYNGQIFLGNAAAQLFYGNGNHVINGLVTGFDHAGADRFIKTGNLVGTTLWMTNNNNNYLQPLRIDSGTVRVSDNGALGLNTTTRSVDLNGGWLEIHTDTPNFQTRNIYNRATNGYIFVDRALGGSGLNQTVEFGNFNANNAT